MPKGKIEILSEARLQLRDVATYYKLKVGPKSAKKITDKILSAIDKLSEFPEIGTVPSSEVIAEAGYKMLVISDYLCFYHLSNEVVYVTHIVHGGAYYIKSLFGGV